MFHIGRSGSTVLANMLAQHPMILSDGEIYGGDPEKWTPARKQPPLDYLKERMRIAGNRIYLFEAKFWHAAVIHMRFDDFFRTLLGEGFEHFIVLKRRNYLRKIVSSRRAQESGIWRRAPGESIHVSRVRIDPLRLAMDQTSEPLLAYLERYDRSFAALDVLLDGHSTLRLTYEEDIEQDAHTAYHRVCDFLEIDRHPVVVEDAKLTPFPLKDVIINFDEVDRALRGTRFHWMLSE